MLCKQCGSKIKKGENKCSNCGWNVETESKTVKKTGTKKAIKKEIKKENNNDKESKIDEMVKNTNEIKKHTKFQTFFMIFLLVIVVTLVVCSIIFRGYKKDNLKQENVKKEKTLSDLYTAEMYNEAMESKKKESLKANPNLIDMYCKVEGNNLIYIFKYVSKEAWKTDYIDVNNLKQQFQDAAIKAVNSTEKGTHLTGITATYKFGVEQEDDIAWVTYDKNGVVSDSDGNK